MTEVPFPEPKITEVETSKTYGYDGSNWVSVSVGSNGEIDVNTNLSDALASVANDELRTRVFANDDDGNLIEIQGEQLDQGIAQTVKGLLTYDSRALSTIGQDEVRVDLQSNNLTSNLDVDIAEQSLNRIGANLEQIGGTSQSGVDVADKIDQIEDALASVANDELRTRVFANDDDGNLIEIQGEQLDQGIAQTVKGLLTYDSRALSTIGQDEVRVDLQNNNAGTINVAEQNPIQIEDKSNNTIDPAKATNYPNNQTISHDLINDGDLAVGPEPVEKSQAIIIAANSTDSNTWSASVDWEDGNGNKFRTESKTDISLDGVVDDNARLNRKGPQVKVTFTDESGGANNNINAYVDVHR